MLLSSKCARVARHVLRIFQAACNHEKSPRVGDDAADEVFQRSKESKGIMADVCS